MSDLSIFVDESGDFGAYESHAPFYLFTLVFHNQDHSIVEQINNLESGILDIGLREKTLFSCWPYYSA